MVDNNGICVSFDYIHPEQKMLLICAIWTQTEKELIKLIKVCEYNFFDSTDPKLKNGWIVIPVYVIDYNRHILSGGFCFLAFETDETISLLLSQIFTPDIAEENVVIITDEDQFYRSPIADMNHSPYHVFCAIHKKNFDRHLKESDINKFEKLEAKNLITKICYSTNKINIDNCFSFLFQLKDAQLVNYIRKIHNDKNYFCEAFIQKCTLVYNTSSVAEFINRIIKSDTKIKKMFLAEFRRNYNRSLKRSYRNAQIFDSELLCPITFPFLDITHNAFKICVIEIFTHISKSKNYIIVGNNENNYFVAHKEQE